MMPFLRKSRFQILILALSQIMGGALIAGQPVSVESPAGPVKGTNGLLSNPDRIRSSRPAPEVPIPPTIKSPVVFFRELLAMTPSERVIALSNRPAENRKLILAKIREYRSLSENERELRLKATELEWYLVPLMKAPATNRAARLAVVPDEYQKMIQARLNQWDLLPDGVKKELLDQRESLRLYVQMTSGSPVHTNSAVPQRPKVEEDLKRIQQMTEADRQKLISLFNQYFDLSDHEKQRALRTLSAAEQEQIRKSLAKYENLTAAQRAQCIRSFGEFSKMSYVERQQFLKNAERWIVMTPDQRQAWRDVVEKVSVTPPPFAAPPRPPGLVPTSDRKADLTTNGN
jgi:hypothetical protein